MTFKVRCPNGHKLRLEEKDCGKKGVCPKCHVRFTLPYAAPHRPVSDTSILTVLGNPQPDKSVVVKPPAAEAPTRQHRVCPKCDAQISAGYQICPKCRTYLPLDTHGLGPHGGDANWPTSP